MMNRHAVVFDMDGVIVHTNPYHEEAFRAFFIKHNIDFSDRDFAGHMYGKHNSYIFSHFYGRPIQGDELKILEDEKEAMFRDIYRDIVEPIDGFVPFLSKLKQAGIPTGVATSAPRANLDLITGQLDIKGKMGSLLASEDVTRHKPDPEIYLRSAQLLQTAPEYCVVFEDSFSGVSAALAAGAKVIGVLSSHTMGELPPCHHYIKDYRDLDADLVLDLLHSVT